MALKAVEKSDLETVAGWLAEESNYRWFDFGGGQQILGAAALAVMRQRALHELRLYCAAEPEEPVGVVALSNIAKPFGSATLWYVLGRKDHGGQGCTSAAVGELLNLAFGGLALTSVNAWAVASNAPSIRVLEKNGFRMIGRQRCCHRVAGRLEDRLLFDLLADEHGK